MSDSKRTKAKKASRRLIRPTDAAKRMGVTVQTLFNWRTQRGIGPRFYVIGGHTRYDIRDIEQWLRSARRNPSKAAAHE